MRAAHKVSPVAFLRLTHLRIALSTAVSVGVGGRDDCGNPHRARSQQHPMLGQMLVDELHDALDEPTLPQQMPTWHKRMMVVQHHAAAKSLRQVPAVDEVMAAQQLFDAAVDALPHPVNLRPPGWGEPLLGAQCHTQRIEGVPPRGGAHA